MRSMDVSCSPDSLISYPGILYHVPLARVLVRSPFRFTCFLTCTNMDCRLVYRYLFVSRFPFCLVDLYTYVSRLCLSPFVLSTCLHAYHYCLHLLIAVCWLVSWPVFWLISLLRTFVIVLSSSLYIRLEMRTLSSSSIYFATTLKVWPARSHELSSSSLARWPRLLLCVFLGACLLCLLAYR